MSTIIETTDAAGNVSTSYSMDVGDMFLGTLSPNTNDWIKVTLVAGQTYSIGMVGIGAAASGVTDPLIKLHGADGAVLLRNDDGGPGYSSALTFTATSSGTYFVDASALTTSVNGDYGVVLTEGDRPSYGVEMGAAVLYRPGSSWSDAPDTPVTLTWGVRATGPARDASNNPTGFIQLSDAQISAAKSALANYSDVANVTFVQVNPTGTTNNATVLIGAYNSATDGAGAYAQFPGGTGATNKAGDLWINNDSVSRTNLPIGSYDQFVFLHELGHVMGLAHPGDYNAAPGVSITYQNNAQFLEDSNQYSVMSYFNATDTEPKAPTNYCDTLMMYDIYAIQQMYGVNHTTRAGNTVYGFHSNQGGAYNFVVNSDPLMCIWDGAGIDTIDLSGFGGKQVIDLSAGHFSDVGGFKGNLSIALGAEIENAVGGRGADQIYGNELGNVLKGGAGLDILIGEGGDDRLVGGKGADGFIFLQGYGQDTVVDFNKATDLIGLSTNLWGGVAMTAAEVLSSFGFLRGGHVVLDFGADELSLLGVHTLAGLESQLNIT